MAVGKPELLSPCGSPEAVKAAVKAGADAVYLGGEQFNARMGAKNFTPDALRSVIDYCHKAGVKVYITLNTQVYDRRMREALAFAASCYEMGADALIITDLGLIGLIREHIPGLPLHASTQLMGNNAAASRHLAGLGIERMVCARELTREDIASLCAESPIEIEAFVHGALCASQSGGCLFSSMIGGRSGNRGECAQPCRLPYNGAYPLSLKDNCLAKHIPDLTATGVACLKIEGRMKAPDYVGGVTAVYRTLLDGGRSARGDEMAYLAALFSRSGFTDGYFTGKTDKSMVGVRTESDKNARVPKISFPQPTPKAPICYEREKITLPEGLPKPKGKMPPPVSYSARFYNKDALCCEELFDIIYLPLYDYDPRANGVLLPPVIPPSEYEKARRALLDAVKQGAGHVMVPNIGGLELARECGATVHLDYRFNVYNSHSALYLERYGEVMLSPELTIPQMRDIPAYSGIVYGRLPLMTLERPTGAKKLTDRKGVSFPVITEAGRELVVNSVPIYMADKENDLKSAGLCHRHFIFTVEDKQTVKRIINDYKNKAPAKGAFTRIKAK